MQFTTKNSPQIDLYVIITN